MGAVKALTRLLVCAGVSERSLLADSISTKLPCGPRHEKTCPRRFANKDADQPAHPRSLISTFFSLIGKYHIQTCYKRNFNFLAEQAGLNLTLSETPKTGFLATSPNCNYIDQSMRYWYLSHMRKCLKTSLRTYPAGQEVYILV